MIRRLVVKIAVGAHDAERAQTALSVCAAAGASGVDVSLWLANDAVWLGTLRPGPDYPTDPELAELFDAVRASGTPVWVCARCAQRRAITAQDLRPGVDVGGAAAFVMAVTAEGTQALVY